MTFKEQLTTDLDIFINSDEFAEDATFTPVAGDAVSCSVLLDKAIEEQPNFEAGYSQTGVEIEALVSDVGTPGIGSTFLINSTTYTVKQIIENDGDFVRMAVR